MANTKKLTVYLLAKNDMKKGMKSATFDMKRWAMRMGSLAKGAGIMIGAAIATGLGISIRSFLKLDSAMTKSLAISSGVNARMRSELLKTAQTMSKSTLFSADKLAEGYFYLTSAGKTLTQSQIQLADVAKFAQAGQFDLATATTLLVDSQKALGLATKNVGKDQLSLIRVSDVLAKANTLSNANIQQFSESLTNGAAPAMKAFNINLEEGVAVLAAYAQQGIKGAEAGQMFGRMLRLMIPSAVQNRKEWEKLNIQVFDSHGNMRKMHEIVRQMTDAFAPMSVAQRSAALESLGFQKRMQQAVFPVIGAADAIQDYEKALRKAKGTTKEIADKQLNSVNAQFKLLGNNLNASAAEMLHFEEGANSLAQGLKIVNNFFQQDASLWINTIKTLWIELKFGFKQSIAIGQVFFHNVGLGIYQMYDAYRVMGKALIQTISAIADAAMKFIRFGLRAFQGAIKLVKADLVSVLEIMKNPFKAGSWSDALVGNKVQFGKALASDFKKTLDSTDALKIDIDPVNYLKGMKSISETYHRIELEKQKALEDSVAARIKRLAGHPLDPFPKGEEKKKLLGGMAPVVEKARLESSIVQAVQKGSVEALKLENSRVSGEKKIEQNTQRTAREAGKINKILSEIKNKINPSISLDNVDAFARG